MVRHRGKGQAGQSTMEYLLVLMGIAVAVYVVGTAAIKRGRGEAGGTGIFNKAETVLAESAQRVVQDLNIKKVE